MANFGIAPARVPSRVMVGPVSSQGGFQYWYLTCLPDRVVAVRQSIGAFFLLGLPNSGSAFGLLGVLLRRVVMPMAQNFRKRTESELQKAAPSQLRGKPNVSYPVSQLKSITYKAKKGAPFVMSDLVLETADGRKTRYGISSVDFDRISAQLKQMYPTQFQMS